MSGTKGFIYDNQIGEIPAVEFTEADGVTYLVPGTPASGQLRLYPKSDHLLYYKDSTGTERVIEVGTTGAYVKTAPTVSSDNVVSAATTTIRTLALKTTDNNTTNNLLEFLSSTNTVLAHVGATGLAAFAGLDSTVIGGVTPAAATVTTLTANTKIVASLIEPPSDSTTALLVKDSAGSNTIVTIDSTNLFVGIGNTPVTELTVFSTSASDPRGIMSAQYSTDTNGARLHLRKARGSVGTPTTIVTGDTLGRLRFSGYDGSNFLQMASIDAISTGTIAATRVPTYMSFSVATNAAPSVLTEVAQMQIGGLQLLGGNYIKPSTDSTAAIIFTKADGTTAVMEVDSTNIRIGVGGAPISYKIESIGTANNLTDASIWIRNSTNGSAAGAVIQFTSGGGGSSSSGYFGAFSNSYTGAALLVKRVGMNLNSDANGLTFLLGTSGQDVRWAVGGSSETMRFDSSGNVYIGGASNASARIHTLGAASGKAAIFQDNATTPGDTLECQTSGGAVTFAITAGGGHIVKTRVVIAAGAVTVATTDYMVEVNKTVGAATTVNLPAAPVTGTQFIIKDGKGDAASNNITITPAAGNIDGAGTYVMNQNFQSVVVIYDGTQWTVN